MTKAQDVLNELLATSELVDVAKVEDLKGNELMIYKDGTEHAGMISRVVQMHPERQTVDLKVGQATRVDVPLADLQMMVRSV